MKLARWRVRSLRRFRDHEVILYVYLGIGSLLSMVYFIAAAYQTRLYVMLFHPNAWNEHAVFIHTFLSILTLSILRAVLWLPQLFWQVILGGASLVDWLIAANITKELM